MDLDEFLQLARLLAEVALVVVEFAISAAHGHVVALARDSARAPRGPLLFIVLADTAELARALVALLALTRTTFATWKNTKFKSM